MEIKCIKCRYKYEINIGEEQKEATVICPRCGAIQKAMQSPDVPETVTEIVPDAPPAANDDTAAAAGNDTSSAGNAAPPTIPEDHLKYIPSDQTEQQTEPEAVPMPIPIAPHDEPKTLEEPKPKPATPATPPEKKSSCGKMFALGCLIVAVLAVLTIAILSFAGKKLFNSISSSDKEEQEQVEQENNNITIQPADESSPTGTSDNTDGAQQTAETPPATTTPVTDTGDEGNSNTAVREPRKLSDEERQKAERNVAKAGGSYNCKGTMANASINLTLNVTSGGFVTGKLVDNTRGVTLEITGDKYGEEFFLNASNSSELISINLKREGKTLKGTAKKELQNMPVSVSY
ncbi:MAG: hypothetical protein SOZ80_07950 [Prevotella sp.]|uniref:hypothetical protein n=1 Tax=Prevotella sp. TaxID=59823 RepID=UPI002A33CD51|nr:hypothetical protein [Prevotella sp.]MDD7317775.1 hypothetical protein [Prevotellaceae bacterium]MDY4020690.1 hypothetical protein [Prevotella sp.]